MQPDSPAQSLADTRNSAMKRRDIEWVVNGNGELYLRDRADWTAENTRSIERRHEEERQRWLREHHTTYREAAE